MPASRSTPWISTEAERIPDTLPEAPATEGIKYAGSKLRLLPHILALARLTGAGTVFDGFSGSTRVSQAFAKSGYAVTANDTAEYSRVFATAYLLNREEPARYGGLIDHLNGLKPVSGWFTEHYGGAGDAATSVSPDGLKKPWQRKNTMKLDAIRDEIDRLDLDEVTRSVCLVSLILALDRVDSTLGHFASYLSGWSPRSYGDLRLEIPHLPVNEWENRVLRLDIFDAMKLLNGPVDLAYLDPPYGSNNDKMPPSRVRYRSYYHLWTTICLNDRPPLVGKAKRRADVSDMESASVFEEYRRGENGRTIVIESIERMIRELDADTSSFLRVGGRATAKELNDVLRSSGRIVEIREIEYRKNVMAAMRWTNDWVRDTEDRNREFLFLVRK
jgi:adenine-specific DNA-methyltransferase